MYSGGGGIIWSPADFVSLNDAFLKRFVMYCCFIMYQLQVERRERVKEPIK